MNIWLELIKLGAQLVGAIFIARLAVQWALERFKSEKSWERQVVALVDVVAAMGAMRRVTRRWLDDHYSQHDSTEEYNEQLRKLRREAELKVQEVSAAGRLILPSQLAEHIEITEKKLHATHECPNYEEMLSIELDILETRSEELIVLGRGIFDADAVRPPDPLLHPWQYLAHRNRLRLSYADDKP